MVMQGYELRAELQTTAEQCRARGHDLRSAASGRELAPDRETRCHPARPLFPARQAHPRSGMSRIGWTVSACGAGRNQNHARTRCRPARVGRASQSAPEHYARCSCATTVVSEDEREVRTATSTGSRTTSGASRTMCCRTAMCAEARDVAQRRIDLPREYRTRLIADVVLGKLEVRAAAATLPEEPDDAVAVEADCVNAEGKNYDRPDRDPRTEVPATQREMTP